MKVSIEYGHTYSDDKLYTRDIADSTRDGEVSRELTPFEAACAVLGDSAAELAIAKGFEVKKHVLVDDVELAFKQDGNNDSWRYAMNRGRISKAVEQAYKPDEVVSEASIVGNAMTNLQKIREKTGKAGSHVRLQTPTGEQRVRLTGFKDVEDPEHPSCDILDLAWHQKRGTDAEVLVTVLHEGYADQQARVHGLAELLAEEPLDRVSAATVFVDDLGQTASMVRWAERDEQATAYFNELESQLSTERAGNSTQL